MIKVQEFCDMKKFNALVSNWSKSTGLGAVVYGVEGENIMSYGLNRDDVKKVRDFEFQVHIDDAEKADAVFTKLMGDQVDLRKNFIQAGAASVDLDDLDF